MKSDIKSDICCNLLSEAVKLDRYFYDHYNSNGIIKGIDIIKGPTGFDIKKIDTEKLGIEQYETSIIYKYLIKFNKLLEKYNVKTIQSSISYYIDVEDFSPPYFQIPFIEFVGDKNTILIMKKIVNHDLASSYQSYTFPTFYDNKQVIRTTLLRPYIDSEGNKINDFNDTDFWDNILIIIKSISDENIILQEISCNDSELDIDKSWYIIDPDGIVEKIPENEKKLFNPFIQKIPLSTLYVRYENNILSFMKKMD